MEGLGQAQGGKSIHDDLFVRALHLAHGDAQAVIARETMGLTPVTPDLRSALVDLPWPLQPPPPRAEFEAVLKNQEERFARRRWAEDMLLSYWEYHWPSPLTPGGEPVLQDALRRWRDTGAFPNE